MTRAILLDNPTLDEIWESSDLFLDYLNEKAPTFANEYLSDATTSAKVKEIYTILAEYYEDSMIIGIEKQFMINFRLHFTQLLPAYWNSLAGELSTIININNVGDFSFTGSQTTDTDGDPFATPKHSGSFNFRQLSGQELKDALKARSGDMEEFILSFSHFFQILLG